MAKGVKAAGSPTAEDVEVDVTAGQGSDTTPESSTGNDETTTESSTVVSAGAGEPSTEKKTTPLDELRGKLTGGDQPEATDDTEEEAKADTEDAGAEEEVDREPTEEAKGDEPDAEPDGDEPEDPFKGIKPEDRNRLGKVAQARIRELHSKAQVLDKQAKEHAPLLNAGRFLEKVRVDHDLTEDDVVGALQLSAAFKRSDPKAVKALEQSADDLRRRLKMPPRAGDSKQLKPFVGALPQEYADMVGILGMDEKRVRYLLAADKAREAAEAKQAATPDEPEPEQEEDEEPVQRPQRREPERQPQHDHPGGFHPADRAAADDAVADLLASKGVKEADLKAHMAKLNPYLDQRAPVNPQTGKPDRRLIPPERRVKAVEIAHQRFVIAEAKRVAEAKKTAAPHRSGGTTPVAKGSSAGKAATPITALRKQLVGH